jgi:prepilin-type N-terminal cleavage/methylation domain-containing protein
MRRIILARTGGFTFVELLVAMAVMVVLMGIGAPVLARALEKYRIGMAIRDVERDLQTARLKAVSSNHPIRVRFNCPSAGFYRVVELIGEAGTPLAEDDGPGRCSPTQYPYPPADLDPLTRPNHDGPLRQLPPSVSFGSSRTLEFWPDGSVHTGAGSDASPWPVVTPTGVEISVQQGTKTAAVVVNGIGRVSIVR